MKFSSTTVTLLLSTLVASRSLSLFGGQKVFNADLEVPGENPLEFCNADRAGEILELEFVDLTPNPPIAYVLDPRDDLGGT
jgi:hypothetical protein